MRVLAGRYELREPLGVGGMGQVFRAHDRVLQRDVALKLLHSSDQQSLSALEEARTLASVSHSAIVQVLDAGEDGDRRFLVMELVDGMPLSTALQDHGELTVDQAVTIAADIADGLVTVHEHGIIHRDIKPQNILITSTGHPKLIDFGIAGRDSDAGGAESFGSVGFAAPEQIEGGTVDSRADIYGLGAVLREMLAGGTVPVALQPVLSKALAHDADQRYGSAAEFREALRELLTSSAVGAARLTPDVTQRMAPPAAPKPMRHWPALAAAVLTLALLGFTMARARSSDPGAPSLAEAVPASSPTATLSEAPASVYVEPTSIPPPPPTTAPQPVRADLPPVVQVQGPPARNDQGADKSKKTSPGQAQDKGRGKGRD